MSASEIVSPHNSPAALIPQRGNLGSHRWSSSNKESWDILQRNELGSKLANEPEHFEEKSAALAFQTRSTSCRADVLAGEAGHNGIDFHRAKRATKARRRDLLDIRANRGNVNLSSQLPAEKNPLSVGLSLTVGDGSAFEAVKLQGFFEGSPELVCSCKKIQDI